MAVNSVFPPYFSFQDGDGNPLEAGFIYIGQPGFEARTTPKASFFDIANTIPTGTASGAAIRTRGGFPVRNGAAAAFYVDGDYSISVTDRNGVLLYSSLNTTLALDVGGAIGPVLGPDGNLGAVGIGFVNEANTGWVRSAPGTVQNVVTGVVVSQETATGTVFQQPVSGAGFNSGVLAVAQPLDTDLTAIAALSATGLVARTGAGTMATRQITSSDGSISVTNPGGVAGDINITAGSIFFRLDAAFAGTNGTAVQNFFPQAVTLEAGTVYEYEVYLAMNKTAGTTSHSISVSFGGTHTRNNVMRNFLSSGVNSAATAAGAILLHGYSLGGGAIDMTGAVFNSATANFWFREVGSFSVNAAGTWFPAYQLSAAPGGAWSTVAGSFVKLRKMGAAGSNSSQGAWA